MPEIATALAALREQPIPATTKGFGPLAASGEITAAGLAAQRPLLHEAGLCYPLLTLRESALHHNTHAMAAYCASAGVELAPHGKTMMAPQLAAAQLAAGAWGIAVATIGQLQTYRAFGFSRLLLANELVDPAGIGWLAAQLAADDGFEAYCYVDSLDGVRLLDSLLRQRPAGRPLPVLVELGHEGGRTGCRSITDAVAVARAAAATGTLQVVGASGYEGGIGHDAGGSTLAAVAEFCRKLRALVVAVSDAGTVTGTPIVSAGGSAYFDVVARELTRGWPAARRATVLLRSGAYLTHDDGFYRRISPAERGAAGTLSLRAALLLWAPVLSRPEPGLALLGAGRRDVSFDEGLPVPLRVCRRGGATEPAGEMAVTALNDQHAYLQLAAGAPLAAGDLVGLGISHPCTTFDKWRVIPVVDDDDRVTDAVYTFF